MSNFFELVGFEYKKMLRRRISLVTIIVVFLISVYSPLSIFIYNWNNYIHVGMTLFEAIQGERDIAEALSGQVLDAEFLAAAMESHNQGEWEYDYRQFGQTIGFLLEVRDYDGGDEDFYVLRHNIVAGFLDGIKMSESAKEQLIRLDSELPIWTYEYNFGYRDFFEDFNMMGIFIGFAIALCVAPIFAGEHGTNTKNLLLTAKYGKSKMIKAKIFTALSFCAGISLICNAIVFFMYMAIWGFGGASGMLQLYYIFSPFHLTILQATGILFLSSLLSSIFFGAFVLLLSSKIKSSLTVMAISIAWLFQAMYFWPPLEEISMWLFNLKNLFSSTSVNSLVLFSVYIYDIFGNAVPVYIVHAVFAVLMSVLLPLLASNSFKRIRV